LLISVVHTQTHTHTHTRITLLQDLVWNSESNKAVTRYWAGLHFLKPFFI